MENDRSELRWGVEQRLEFIEFRLFWEGHVNRSELLQSVLYPKANLRRNTRRTRVGELR